jgi:hypothetical protein
MLYALALQTTLATAPITVRTRSTLAASIAVARLATPPFSVEVRSQPGSILMAQSLTMDRM